MSFVDRWRRYRQEKLEQDMASADSVSLQRILAEYQRDVEKMTMIGVNSGGLLGSGALGPTGGSQQGAVSAAPGQKAGPLPLKHHSSEALVQMIATRMRYPTAKAMPLEHLHVHAVSENKVIVLVVNGEQHAVLEDDGQFPSDTLINQLRLMID